MRCGRCGHDNQPEALFCEECGSALEISCPQCGQKLRPTVKFCSKCGHRLAQATAAAPSPPPPAVPSPQQYIPRHLATKILLSRAALEGKRRQVTVLSATVANFQELTERLPRETTQAILERALVLLAQPVHRYEGIIVHFLGDRLLVLFGAPIAHDDHAHRAVYAALAIKETFRPFAEHLRREHGVDLQIRMGLHTGDVTVGALGEDLRMDYMPEGDTTSLAVWLQRVAEPGTILISETTRRLLREDFRCEPLPAVRIEGVREPAACYRVEGATGRGAWRELDEQILTRFIGRRQELEALRGCFERMKQGVGQLVSIVGEAGIGKSRLLHEFKRSFADENVNYLESRCLSYGRFMSFFPFIEHLRANFRLDEQDSDQERRRKIGVKLRQAGINVEGWLPLFANLLSIPTEAQFLKTMDPKVLQQRTFQAVRLLTTMDSRVRPLVLVVEDLHWADDTSLEYLPLLIDGLASARVLVLLTYRPDFSPAWGDRPYQARIVLNRLSPAESVEMVTALLQVDRVPKEIEEMIAAKAEGIPYFIEEFTKSLLESGVIVRTDGEYALMGDPRALKVPETIQEVLLGRIDRLHADVKRTMQIGAVVGRSFGLRLLKAVSGLAEAELSQHAEQLKQLELIYQQGFYPEVEFVFTHALIQEVAYEGLQWEQRKALHLAVGRAIEDLARDRLEEQAATLAFHYGRSDQPERAVEYALLAGDKAAGLFANAEATTYYEEALTILRSLPPMPQHEERQIDAMVKLASVSTTRQHFERDLVNLEAAQAIAQRLNDQRRTAQVLYWIARNHYVRGDLGKSVEFAERSLTVASESLQDEGLIVWPVNLLGRIYTATGDFVNGRLMMQRSVELLERLGNQSELSTSSSILAVALAATGEFQEAFRFSEQGLRLAREIQNLPGEAANCYYRAIVYEQKGEWNRVVEDCLSGLEIARRIRDPFRVYVLTCLLGYGWFRLGEAQRGIDTLREGIGLAEQLGTKYLLVWAFAWLSDSHLVQRDFGAALEAASRALSLVVPGSDFFGEGLAARCYGEALCQQDPGRMAEAEAHIQRAIRLQEEKGMKPHLARSYVGYTRLLQAKGEAEKAREHLERARALFQELDMQWHLRRLAEAFG